MIKQLAGLQLLMMLFILTSFIQGRLHANQFSYVFPPNISLQIIDQHEESGGKIRLTALIESRLGTLEDLEVFFESSKDMQILSNTSKLKTLPPGAPRKVKILAVKTSKIADELGSWLKMGVRFTPDYQAIRTYIADKSIYPDDFERQKLVNIVDKNVGAEARYLEAVRHFIKAD
ncbi:MAG: hypothetical protein PHD82_00020 [Candidatus Riflebacteria bacterium]|jgi:hypothetical protein|nr:hypothetical protein [Candidatus Riflebacteria bacterium]